jgi:hypothetical protein
MVEWGGAFGGGLVVGAGGFEVMGFGKMEAAGPRA